MKSQIRKLLSEALGNMYANGQIFSIPDFDLSEPKQGFGDYSTGVAFVLAREQKVGPNDCAQAITRQIELLDKGKLFAKAEVLNGFINFSISKDMLAAHVFSLQGGVKIEKPGLRPDGAPKKIVFEYSSPNANKPLHIGHTRNNIYGMSCINLLRATGHAVTAVEVINDRGIHIMKSVLMYMKYGAGATPQSEGIKPDHFVGKFYSMFSEKAAESEEQKRALESEAQELLLRWENGDDQVREIWKKMNAWFYSGLEQTYARDGSNFDDKDFESEFYDKGKSLVNQGVEMGIFKKDADGGVYVDLTSQGLDKKYLLRSDGTSIYITQELYLWVRRYEKWSFDEAIVTTSSEQSYHFDALKRIFRMFGYSWAEKFQHLPYEHVYLGTGKMSSRAGNAVSEDDLIEMIKQKVCETMKSSRKIKASAEDDSVVEAIALAAIKYAYLKYDRNTKIYFDIDQTISIEGNTGPYIQYAYARIQSVLKKAGDFKKEPPKGLVEDSELLLARHLLHYEDVLASAALEFKPNALCNYLFQLASKFNSFYDQVSILGAESERLKIDRLNLLVAAKEALGQGLSLLGIKTLDQM